MRIHEVPDLDRVQTLKTQKVDFLHEKKDKKHTYEKPMINGRKQGLFVFGSIRIQDNQINTASNREVFSSIQDLAVTKNEKT
jgi:hypothetical protein